MAYPSFMMLNLDVYQNPDLGENVTKMTIEICFLPNQLQIFMMYVVGLILSIVLVIYFTTSTKTHKESVIIDMKDKHFYKSYKSTYNPKIVEQGRVVLLHIGVVVAVMVPFYLMVLWCTK